MFDRQNKKHFEAILQILLKIDSLRYSYLQTTILDFIEDLTNGFPDIANITFKDAVKHLSNKERDSIEVTERLEDMLDIMKNQHDANLESTSSFQVLTTLPHAFSNFGKQVQSVGKDFLTQEIPLHHYSSVNNYTK